VCTLLQLTTHDEAHESFEIIDFLHSFKSVSQWVKWVSVPFSFFFQAPPNFHEPPWRKEKTGLTNMYRVVQKELIAQLLLLFPIKVNILEWFWILSCRKFSFDSQMCDLFFCGTTLSSSGAIRTKEVENLTKLTFWTAGREPKVTTSCGRTF